MTTFLWNLGVSYVFPIVAWRCRLFRYDIYLAADFCDVLCAAQKARTCLRTPDMVISEKMLGNHDRQNNGLPDRQAVF